MPFLEFAFSVILLIIAVGLAVVLFGAFAAIFGGIAVFSLFTGWIPILMCATDPEYAIGFVHGTVGSWAAIALIEYTAFSLLCLGLLFFKPDPDGLPPGWKFLSIFYSYEPTKLTRVAVESDSTDWDQRGFVKGVRNGAPNWGFHKQASAWQMRQEARRAQTQASKMKTENDRRQKEAEAANELADAMIALEREKARKKGYDDQ